MRASLVSVRKHWTGVPQQRPSDQLSPVLRGGERARGLSVRLSAAPAQRPERQAPTALFRLFLSILDAERAPAL